MTAWSIEQGDVREVLTGYNDNVFDAVACDPPYGFRFMNKSWDYDVPSVATWRECLRVLKPGGLLVSFGGSRTYHRLACGVEDAGFELRDQLMWLYGKGFPKSQNIGLALDKAAGATRQVGSIPPKQVNVTAPATELAQLWDGYGTALKPAHEPIVLARKPLDGTMAQNVARWGVGGLGITACRVGDEPNESGRWPANLLLDEDAAALLDAEVGDRPSVPFKENTAEGAVLALKKRTAGGYSDSGGPSRFFYCSKVSTREREAGCEGLPRKSAQEAVCREGINDTTNAPHRGASRTGGARNYHPTLKPIALTTWLARLLLPPTTRPVILVPFAGAGSEMIGCLKAGWAGVLGIEREAEYATIARARLAYWCPESEVA